MATPTLNTAGPARPEIVEVTEPLGPGLDFEVDHAGRPLIGVRARTRPTWLGLDRAELLESDDGSGRAIRVLVAVPTSTFAGCRVQVLWTGALVDRDRPILVGRVAGIPDPLPAVARTIATSDGRWLGPTEASRLAADGRRLYRTRRAADRIVGGRGWEPRAGSLEDQRFTSPHARSEYTLAQLPPRYLRGLRQVLDSDEHVLYAVERPALTAVGLVQRVARRIDRRGALLVLTDRQVAWVVDHADPDRYLSDWGVDIELVPLERLVEVAVIAGPNGIELRFATSRGQTCVALPPEYGTEAEVAAGLARRFAADPGHLLPRRTYPVPAAEPDWSRADTFGQEADARALYARIANPIGGILFSPRRSGQRQPALWAASEGAVLAVTAGAAERLPISGIHALRVVLSPLAGRLELTGETSGSLTYPAPFGDMAAAFVRSTRRLMANMS